MIAQPSRQRFEAQIHDIPAGSKVLEVGCGPESACWDLWENGVEVHGIDISGKAIELAKQRALDRGIDPGNFTEGNAEHPDFADNTFDYILGSGILHHLDLDIALPEFRRVMGDSGRVLLREPLGQNPLINLYRRVTPSERSADEHPLSMADLERLGDEFGGVSTEYFHLCSLAAIPLIGTRPFARVHATLERFDRMLFKRFPRLRAYAWVVVINCGRQ